MKALTTKVITAEEYLSLEEKSESRNEFINGTIIEMPGGSKIHNNLCLNYTFILRGALKGRDCEIFSEGVKVELLPEKNYFYPDVVVSCDERDKFDSHFLRYPSLVIEVLSDSNYLYDRVDKFLLYRKLETLEQYILVTQQSCHIESYCRSEGWKKVVFTDLEAWVEIKHLGISIKLEDIYEGVFSKEIY